MTRHLWLIGIGAGNPDWVTAEAIEAIRQIDVLFVVIKEGKYDELVDARRTLFARYRTTDVRVVELNDPPRPWRKADDYAAVVALWRAQRQELWTQALMEHLEPGQTGGLLVWGDPSLYESTLAIVQSVCHEMDEPPLVRVIPGVSCVHALTAAHQICLNRQGRSVTIMPARLLREGLSEGQDDVVVMLDAQTSFTTITEGGWDIYWGAYLGTPDEILISGDLSDVADEIVRVRAEAAERKGWMFDTYLLRRR